MINNDVVNSAAFATNYMGKVARVASRGILARGMITQIAEHLGFEFNLEEDHLVERRGKIDMDALVHQGMISVDGNTYTVIICNKDIFDLPNPRKVKDDVMNNWLYNTGAPTPDNSSGGRLTLICLIMMHVLLWRRTLSHHLLIRTNMKPRHGLG